MRWAALLLAVASCGGGLPDATQGAVLLMLLSTGKGQSASIFPSNGKGCLSVNASADLDGRALTKTQPGGWSSSSPLCSFGGCICTAEVWSESGTPPDVPESTLTLTAGQQQWTVKAEHLYAQRTFAPAGPGVFLWSPATDVLFQPSGYLSLSDGGQLGVNLTYDAGVLTITDALAPGRYTLNLAPPQVSVPTCDGPMFCVVQGGGAPAAVTFTIP
jgi:hypothetical protein